MTNTTNYVTSKIITSEQIEEVNGYFHYDKGSRYFTPQGFAFYYNQNRINHLDLCDADRYAILNTVIGYDIGIDAFRKIDEYVWNELDFDLLELTGNNDDKKIIKKAFDKTNSNLDFSKWRDFTKQIMDDFNKRRNGEEVEHPFSYSYFEDGIEYK